VGTWKIWIGTASLAAPLLDVAPSGSWIELGSTDGDQEINFTGALTALSDNEHTGPRKHVRAEEGVNFKAALAHLTLESLAKIRGLAATQTVTTTTSGTLAVKKLPNKRGYIPARYALLARGGAVEASNTMSAYLAGPAQLWIPLGVFDSEPTEAYSKGGSPTPEFTFTAEEDTTQAAGDEMGWLMMQSS